jgi:hypothetical protein
MQQVIVAAAAACSLIGANTVQAGTLIPIAPVPGSTSTIVMGINNSNVITGYEVDAKEGLEHGFTGPYAGPYTVFSMRNAQSTRATGINDDGVIVGTAHTAGDYLPFVREPSGKIIVVRQRKGPDLSGSANGIGDNGWFVGFGAYLGPYYGRGTHYKAPFSFPISSDLVVPITYRSDGTVTGEYWDSTKPDVPGFILQNGTAITVRYPDAASFQVALTGVNNDGLASGTWFDHSSNPHAFLFDMSTNAFRAIVRNQLAEAGNINDDGLVPVNVMSGSTSTPYLYCPRRAARCPAGAGPSRELP